MRVQITNKSSRPDSIIVPLVEYAASFFPHRTGRIEVIIKNTRRGRGTHGKCYNGRCCVVWVETIDNGPYPGFCQYPCTFLEMHYFRHANNSSVKALTAYDWKEYTLSVIAHEMEHTTKSARQMRRSRQEIHAWNRAAEVTEAARTDTGRAILDGLAHEVLRTQQHKQDRKVFKNSAEAKRENVENLMTKWQRKLKLAQTKIRKLKIRAKYFDKKIAASGSPREK